MSSGKWRSFRFGLNVLKPDLEVFDVTMHEDKYGQESQITRPVAKTRKNSLDHNYNMTLSISSYASQYITLDMRICCPIRVPGRELCIMHNHVLFSSDSNDQVKSDTDSSFSAIIIFAYKY